MFCTVKNLPIEKAQIAFFGSGVTPKKIDTIHPSHPWASAAVMPQSSCMGVLPHTYLKLHFPPPPHSSLLLLSAAIFCDLLLSFPWRLLPQIWFHVAIRLHSLWPCFLTTWPATWRCQLTLTLPNELTRVLLAVWLWHCSPTDCVQVWLVVFATHADNPADSPRAGRHIQAAVINLG